MSKPKIFSREKVLHYKQCKNKMALVFTMYPQGPSAGLCNMDVQCLPLECLPIQFSEENYKFQTIILTHGKIHNVIFQGDHKEDTEIFILGL